MGNESYEVDETKPVKCAFLGSCLYVLPTTAQTTHTAIRGRTDESSVFSFVFRIFYFVQFVFVLPESTRVRAQKKK